ncbi:MAG: hypothetical protein QNJ98_17120 [Planctomycetota bacterium]|nr:hypothetical protein [Planctomycetota bacterium]
MTAPDTPKAPLVQRLVKLGLVLSLTALVFVWPAAVLADTLTSKEVVMIGSRFGADEVELNQLDFDPEFAVDAKAPKAKQEAQLRDEIASIYGLNPTAPTKVLFVSSDDLIQTKEDPSLLLLVRAPGDYVLQSQTVYWFAKMVTYGAAGAALLFFGLLSFLRRRRAVAVEAQPMGA